jgi:hypothetical protein
MGMIMKIFLICVSFIIAVKNLIQFSLFETDFPARKFRRGLPVFAVRQALSLPVNKVIRLFFPCSPFTEV